MNPLSLLANAEFEGTVWLPPEASTVAGEVDWLFWLIFYLCTFFFVAITVAAIYFSIKYRRLRPDQPPLPSEGHNTRLEIFWTAVPMALVVWIFYVGLESYEKLQSPPHGAYTVDVTGQKWSWEFRYPNGVVSQDGNLHVPAGEPVRLLMQSRDVLHAMYIPAMRVKQDLVPGRYTQLWFEAVAPTEQQLTTTVRDGEATLGDVAKRLQVSPADLGHANGIANPTTTVTSGQALKLEGAIWHLTCAEYCGDGHSAMFRKVIVHPTRASFDDWLRRQDVVDVSVETGRTIYTQYCSSCHSTTPGERKIGPSWGDLARDLRAGNVARAMADGTSVIVDENYVLESVMDPAKYVVDGYRNEMTVFRGTLKHDHVAAVLLYMRTLGQ